MTRVDPPRRACLRLVVDGTVRQFMLDRPIFQIGRAPETCGLVLDGLAIAPQHCCLRRQGPRWWLLDRGSRTGTYVNSRRCREPTELRDGDRISIGLHLIEFRSAPALTLQDTLARLGGPGLDFEPGLAPPVPSRRPRNTLRVACLAATAAFAVTLSVAAHVPPEAPPTAIERPVPSDMSAPTPAPGPAAPARSEYLAEPPMFELPPDAVTRGRPDAGTLLHAVQLPVSPDYQIRCPAHAFASAATVSELMHALATFRNRSGYRGEIVVGDLSQVGGGRYGPHKSHQSGRDVDLWLPVRGGQYRRGCEHCGTDLCRPEPSEVDWQTTWQLVQALASRGSAQDIFLAWELQPALRDAARQLGAPEAELARQIQHPARGRASLVKHADGHTHHLHVRFRCPASGAGCVKTP